MDNDLGMQLVESRESESVIKNLLVIHKAKKEDFTHYNCSADNEFGSTFIAINLKEQSKFYAFYKNFPILFYAHPLNDNLPILSLSLFLLLMDHHHSYFYP